MPSTPPMESMVSFWGPVSLRGGSGAGAVFPSVDHFWSAAAITIPTHMARLAAAEAGPFGHELRTFRFSKGT